MENLQRYRVIIIWAAAGAIALGIFWLAFVLAQRSGKTAFTLTVVPADATVMMNGTKVSSGTYYLLPGKYTITAKAEGFGDYRRAIELTSSNAAMMLPVPLTPISDKAKKWVEDNKALYQAVVDNSRTQEEQALALLKSQNPITDLLSYKSLIYSISYKPDPDDGTNSRIILQIDAPPGYKRAALQKIREWGYDPTDFKIQYMNYQDPFAS